LEPKRNQVLPKLAELADQKWREIWALGISRIIEGQSKYGDAWRTRNNRQELLLELIDAIAYWIFDELLEKEKLVDSPTKLVIDRPQKGTDRTLKGTDRTLKVYVSGPYTNGDRAKNIERADAAGRAVLKMGAIPFVPHTMTKDWEKDPDFVYRDFLNFDLEWLRLCDAILMLEDWEHSPGAKVEREEAGRLGLLIFHSLDELEAYMRGK